MYLTGIALIALATGCTHRMEVTNLDNYRVALSPPVRTPRNIGVTTANAGDFQSERYVSAVVGALKKNGTVGRVVYPYKKSAQTDPVDWVVDIAVNARYDGRGSNFFVNFPGFLIFAPAIWGYGYTADITTDYSIATPAGDLVSQQSITSHYDFRHADMNRTWTEVSWFEVGVIALVGGVVFTGYDASATSEFITEVSPNYGPFIAQKIVAALPEQKTSPARVQEAAPGPPAGGERKGSDVNL